MQVGADGPGLGQEVDQRRAELVRVERAEPDPGGTGLRSSMAATSQVRLDLRVEVGAIAAEVDAGQDDFLKTLLGQPVELLKDATPEGRCGSCRATWAQYKRCRTGRSLPGSSGTPGSAVQTLTSPGGQRRFARSVVPKVSIWDALRTLLTATGWCSSAVTGPQDIVRAG